MHTLHDFLLILLPLFVVVDPAGTIPVYLGLTSRYSEEHRRRIALRASLVAWCTGIVFVILGQAIFDFLGVQFADFQIAGGILLVILSVLDILSPGKPAVDENAPLDPSHGIVPLAIPLIMGPATLTTSLLLVNTYSAAYIADYGKPGGQIIVSALVRLALTINLLVLYIAMYFANQLAALVGKNTMNVINKIVMILLAAIAVSLIRQGVVSIVHGLQ